MIYIKTSVGIEIRQDDLLISSLQRNLAGAVFTHFKRIAGYRLRERAEVQREVDQFFRTNRLSRENVVLGVPPRDFVIRHLDLPLEVADNLKQVILYQVHSCEPTEGEKYYYDFAPLKVGPGSKKLVVLLAMIKQSLLDAHLALMRELGVRPRLVTSGAAALTNLLLQRVGDGARRNYIIADLAPVAVEVAAVRGGALVYSHQAARQEGAAYKDLLFQELEMAAAKTRMDPEDTIDKIILSGEESATIHRDLRDELQDCELMSERVKFEMPLEIRSHLQEAAVSLGLAKSGLSRKQPVQLNLLPPALRTRQTPWAYVPAIALGAIVIALLVGLGFQRIIQERMLVAQLDQQIAVLSGPVKRVQAIRAESESLEKQIRYVEGVFKQRDLNLEVLRELTTILPPDTYLTVYNSNNRDGSITISGLSPSPPDLILKLERSPYLMNVGLQGTVYRDAQSGKDRFTFTAKMER